MTYYSVAKGIKIGIYNNWEDCKSNVKGYSGAIYKKFKTFEEANNFLNNQGIKSIVKPTIINSNEKTKLDNLDKHYFVYTDGACSNNGTKKACAGLGIYFGNNDYRNVSKKIQGKQTNNVAELMAILNTIPIINKDLENGFNITIVSDSQYAIKCCTYYAKKCYKNNWKNSQGKDVPNIELLKQTYSIFKNNLNIKFKHIKAHTGKKDIHSLGNEQADLLATNACIK